VFSLLAFVLFQAVKLPSHGGVVRLIVTGDAGSTHSQLRAGILAVEKKLPIDAIVLTGDNFYPCGIASLNDPQWSKITQHFGPANVPIFAVLGNHDYGDPQPVSGVPQVVCGHPNPQAEVAANGVIAHWTLPARHYIAANDVVELVMIDSEPIAGGWISPFLGSDTSSVETTWLTRQLGEAHARWRIVVGHHTIFSSGEHGRANGSNQRNMRALLPLFARDRVDLYVCGHDHDMELIGDLHRHDAPLFLVSGAGSGVDTMKQRKRRDEPPTIWSPLHEKPFFGFALLEITRSQVAITFYDAAGNARSDRFILQK
jgi:hypothetical protein